MDWEQQVSRGAQTASEATELARCGVQTANGPLAQDFSPEMGEFNGMTLPGVASSAIPHRIMGFLLHLTEARIWDYAWRCWSYPDAFAALLHPDSCIAAEAMRKAKLTWELTTTVESSRNIMPSLFQLREKIYWLSWPVLGSVSSKHIIVMTGTISKVLLSKMLEGSFGNSWN